MPSSTPWGGASRGVSSKISSSQKPVTGLEVDVTASLTQQVERYRLVRAKFPIDCVTAAWSKGSNRSISEAHCDQLRKAFESGLYREDPQHCLRLACSKDEVDRVLAHLQAQGQPTNFDDHLRPWVDFMDWAKVNDRPAELMAGAHRVKALKTFLKKHGYDEGDQSQRWWVCEIYDQGRSRRSHLVTLLWTLSTPRPIAIRARPPAAR